MYNFSLTLSNGNKKCQDSSLWLWFWLGQLFCFDYYRFCVFSFNNISFWQVLFILREIETFSDEKLEKVHLGEMWNRILAYFNDHHCCLFYYNPVNLICHLIF